MATTKVAIAGSGCGNDVRARAAMARRLIIDSLTHLIEVYGADGFRFDLAELIGVEVLREIETALKRVKPDVVLIAEPWSFRGHIAQDLRPTGFASWNDGYRDFLRDYVRGGGTPREVRVFPQGLARLLRRLAGADGQLHRVARRPDLDRHDHRERRRQRPAADAQRLPPHPPHVRHPHGLDRHADAGGRPGFPALQAGGEQHLPARRPQRPRLPAAVPVSRPPTPILRTGSRSGAASAAGCSGSIRGRARVSSGSASRRIRPPPP